MMPAYNPAEGFDTDVSPSGMTVMETVDTSQGTGRNYSTTAATTSDASTEQGDGTDDNGPSISFANPKTAAAGAAVAAMAFFAGRGS